jgi:nitroreductase
MSVGVAVAERPAGMSQIEALVRARYRSADGPGVREGNDALALLLSHRSVRAYLPDPLPDGTIETLIAAAQSAASSSNLQVWSVVAVQDPDRKNRLAALAGSQRHIVEAPLLLVWLIDFDRLTRLAAERGVVAGALDYLETFLLGAVDTSLAAQNAVVALESLGLGSVYIGGIRNRPADVAAELDLPPRMFPLFGLVVGKPDPARPAGIKPRLPQSSVLFHEKYAWSDTQRYAAASYNARLRAFQREQAMVERDWDEQASDRTRGAESMAGRHVLRSVLGELGFDLR